MSTRRPASDLRVWRRRAVRCLRAEQRFDGRKDRLRLGHAAQSIFAASHLALVGPDEPDSVFAERGEVPLRGG